MMRQSALSVLGRYCATVLSSVFIIFQLTQTIQTPLLHANTVIIMKSVESVNGTFTLCVVALIVLCWAVGH